MATALIADDEPLLRRELRDLLLQLWPELHIVEEACDGLSALRAIESLSPDISFLDIRMPNMSGIEVAERVQGLTHVVFVTAFDEHAIAAFEQGAVDYLLKPVKLARLTATIKRVKERVTAAVRDGGVRPLTWIQATSAQQLRFFATNEVIYFQSDSKYTRLVTQEREAFIRPSLIELMRTLDPELFRQISRSVIVNIRHIDRVERGSEGEMFVRMHNVSEPFSVSKSHQSQFRGM